MALGEKAIFLTWNLFWQTAFFPACLVVFAWWLKQRDKKKDIEQAKQDQTAKELEDLKEKNYDEWRGRFVETLCGVKNDVKSLATMIPSLITRQDCDESHEIILERMDNHGNRLTHLESEVQHLQSHRHGDK